MLSKKISLLTIFLLCFFAAAFFKPLKFVDNLLFDLNYRISTIASGDSVLVIGIDSKSIQSIGAMPWPRSIMASLFEKINSASPRAIAADFLFPHRFDTLENDSLSSVLSNINNIVLPFRIGAIGNNSNSGVYNSQRALLSPHTFRIIKNKESLENGFFYSARDTDFGDSSFYNYAKYSGFINISTSRTSHTLREAIHVIKSGDEYFYSFGIAAVAAYYGLRPQEIILDGNGRIILGNRKIPVSSYAASTGINFRNDISKHNCISASSILDGSTDLSLLKDKLIFIGITDPAAGADFFNTPMNPQTPGVLVWANIALDIIEGKWLRESPFLISLANVLLSLFIFPLSVLLFSKRGGALLAGAGFVLFLSSLLVSHIIFRQYHIVWESSTQLYSLLFAILWLSLLKKQNVNLTSLHRFEPVKLIGSDTLAPPTVSEINTVITDTSTLYFVRNLPEYRNNTDLCDELHNLGSGRIIQTLGAGGMADVYLIWNMHLDIYRAVKVIKPELPEHYKEKFDIEARIFSKLDHQNIVHCFSVGTWHTLPYLEMEFINGASLDNVLFKCKYLSVEQTLIAGIIICNALQYAHNQVITVHSKSYKGIIHRDIKPSNIILSRSGRIKLTDFGIAHPGSTISIIPDSEPIIGTLPYLAPEQFDNKELSQQVDIYALGTTLYELVSGKKAFPQTDPSHLLKAKVSDNFEPLHHACHIDRSISSVIEKAMAYSPFDRYTTAQEFGNELEKALYEHCSFKQDGPVTDLVNRYWNT